jgi:HTH-type transcriptional regulator, glycine betaine synthesis regulator
MKLALSFSELYIISVKTEITGEKAMVKTRDTFPPGLNYGTGTLGVDAVSEVVEAVGGLVEFWGFPRALGRVWGLLYLAPEPLTASEIAQHLGMTAGAVTVAIDELEIWGVIGRFCRQGDRREHFKAEDDVSRLIARLLSDRELRQLETAYDSFARAEHTLKLEAQAPTADSETLDFARERIARLRRVAANGKNILQALILKDGITATGARSGRFKIQREE